jgi:hypothetical protein
MNPVMMQSRVRAAVGALAIAAVSAFAVACADKEYRPLTGPGSNKMALQVSVTGLQMADQQAGAFTPKYLVVLAGYYRSEPGEDSIELLAYKAQPLTTGNISVSLPIDLGICLNDEFHVGGKDGCRIVVGGMIAPDTAETPGDTTGNGPDLFETAFDINFKGPFDISPGRMPTIPPIDLSPTRLAAARFAPDEALRRGGPLTPQTFSTAPAGAVTSAGGVVVFAGTQGPESFNQFGPTPFFPQLAIFSNGLWSRVTASTAPPNTSFRDVSALGPNEVYMAHQSGLWRYDGTAITRVTSVSDSLQSVGTFTTAAGAKLVIAGGALGVTWVGNTTTLTRFVLPTTSNVTGVCINSTTEAFAAAGTNLFRFNGTSWSQVSSAGTNNKIHLQCTGPGQAFAASLQQSLLRWDGFGFAVLTGQGIPQGVLVNMAAVSSNEIYAFGDSANVHRSFFRFNGSTWVETGRLRFTQPSIARPWADPRGGQAFMITSFGRLEQWNSTAANVLSYQPSLHDVWVNSSTSAFVVGWNTFLGRWDGTKWNVDAPPAGTPTIRVLQGVWSDGPNNAWAVGGVNTIFRWNGTSWTRISDAFNAVTASDGFNSVWGSGTDVWIAGNATMVRCQSGGAGGVACGTENTGGSTPLYSVWGTSAANVWAVGANGRIVRRDAQGWTPVTSPTTRTLVRVHGSSANDVWALGDSVLIHFDGTSWSQVPMTADPLMFMRSRAPNSGVQNVFQLGLYVRSDRELYLGADGGSIGKFNGFEWQNEFVPFRRRTVGISGVASGCTLAITESQTLSTAPALWRGEGGHGCFSNPMAPPTSWP